VAVRANVIRMAHGDFDTEDDGSGHGISIEGGFENRITANLVTRNANSGIYIDSDSADNVVRFNIVVLNGGPDLFDGSVGGLTAGTANTWQANLALTSSPAGLRGGLFGGFLGGLLGGLGSFLGGLLGP
jgi:parallel beta-helix repeat protein